MTFYALVTTNALCINKLLKILEGFIPIFPVFYSLMIETNLMTNEYLILVTIINLIYCRYLNYC